MSELLEALPIGSVVVVDSAPIVFVLEDHPTLAESYAPLVEAIAAGRLRGVVSTVTLAEIATGPLRHGRLALARRYRDALTSGPGWTCVDLTPATAMRAASLRARYRLKLPDAVQVATALEVEAAALVTHDRDFGAVEEVKILSGLAGLSTP